MDDINKTKEKIVDIIKHKSVLKQKIYKTNIEAFKLLKKRLRLLIDDLKEKTSNCEESICLKYKEKGQFEVQVTIAGDVIIFNMHSNVFKFDENHSIWKSSYLSENEERGYCGIINVYNFLADSYRYNRVNDVGYLVGRMFINSDNHFMVEGKRKLGFLYNDFSKSKFVQESVDSIIQNIVLYSLDFDLFTPPYDEVKEVSVYAMKTVSDTVQLKTGKRMGFQFSADEENLI